MKLKFGQDIDAEIWSRSKSLILVKYKDSFENLPILALWFSTCQIRREKDERCASNACNYEQQTKKNLKISERSNFSVSG